MSLALNNYQQQLSEKIASVRRQFGEFLTDDVVFAAFESPTAHFRQRAEFRLWHERDDEGNNTGEVFYAMFSAGQKAGRKTVKKVEQLPIASRRINALMPDLLAMIQSHPLLVSRLFQIEFLSTLNGETLVTLIYHKALDGEWEKVAKLLEETLAIYIIGRSRKQKIVLSQDFVTETLTVKGRRYRYRQIEGGFTQPNAVVCQKMLTWASDIAQFINAQPVEAERCNDAKDLLELYCGNGNFTLPLSRYFRKVLATEVAKSSVKSARHNIADNACQNIAIARLSAQELTQAFTGQRLFKRLQQDDIDVSDYHISTVFVDPPRAGVDDDTLQLMQQFEHIIYISCNPDTLWDNLQVLKQSHQVVRVALFDQFPYTQHIEMGVWLRLR